MGGVLRAPARHYISSELLCHIATPFEWRNGYRRGCRGRAEASLCGESTAEAGPPHLAYAVGDGVGPARRAADDPREGRATLSGGRSMGQVVVADSDRPVGPMASAPSWRDTHVSTTKNSLSWTIAGNLRQTAEPTIGPHTTAKNWRELTTIKADAMRCANSELQAVERALRGRRSGVWDCEASPVS